MSKNQKESVMSEQLTSFVGELNKSQLSKSQLLAEFDRPKVVEKTPEQIAAEKESYIQIVASFAMEGAEPSDFYKVITMEMVRGEITSEQADLIMFNSLPNEVERIHAKVARLNELGLSWKDL